jgi:hypothetical protein
MLRSTGSGPLSALLVLAPLVALPIFAVVGIPQFAPGNLIDSQNPSMNSTARKGNGTSESRLGEAARSDADDLFAPLGKSANGFDDPLRSKKKSMRSRLSQNGSSDSDLNSDGADTGDVLDSDAETGSRSRGRRGGNAPRFADAGADETLDLEPSSDLGTSSTSGRGSRPSRRGQNRADDSVGENELALDGDEKDAQTAQRKSLAEDGDDLFNSPKATATRGNRSKQQKQLPDESDRDMFEPAAPQKPVRNSAKSANGTRPPAGRARQADPNDAPLFQPSGSNSAGDEATEPEVQEQPAATGSRKQAPRAQQVAALPDDTEEANVAAAPPRDSVAKTPVVKASQEQTLKDLFDGLKAAGMVAESHHFIYVEESDTFLFVCKAARRGSNSAAQKFEEEATEPLLAVYKVLKSVQAWQAKAAKKSRAA